VIVIIDYGVGNLGSILNMLKRVEAAAIVSGNPDVIRTAEKLILPGVGAFDHGMLNLEERGLIPVLEERVLGAGVPILGLCLGVQLFTRGSEEGDRPGLGWVDARTVRFRFDPARNGLKIPHMGWNVVRLTRPHPLLPDIEVDTRFYFVHSYHLECADPALPFLEASYGYPFTAGVARNNIVGVQFHPEKSHKYGMRLLRAFAHDFLSSRSTSVMES
jgi:imidazole glycerol-phosphate synthase subunit HisH